MRCHKGKTWLFCVSVAEPLAMDHGSHPQIFPLGCSSSSGGQNQRKSFFNVFLGNINAFVLLTQHLHLKGRSQFHQFNTLVNQVRSSFLWILMFIMVMGFFPLNNLEPSDHKWPLCQTSNVFPPFINLCLLSFQWGLILGCWFR